MAQKSKPARTGAKAKAKSSKQVSKNYYAVIDPKGDWCDHTLYTTVKAAAKGTAKTLKFDGVGDPVYIAKVLNTVIQKRVASASTLPVIEV